MRFVPVSESPQTADAIGSENQKFGKNGCTLRFFMPAIGILSAACLAAAAVRLNADQPTRPFIELQSGPRTPGLALDESPRPIHQVRLVVDAELARGTLILDGNRPEFDEFDELVGGLQTPHVRGKGDPKRISEFRCNIELTKKGVVECTRYGLVVP
jgi:hypothetical protein